MAKRILMIVALAISTAAQGAGIYGGSAASGILEGQERQQRMELMRAQTEALRAYTHCLQETNNTQLCGPPPAQIPMSPPQYQPTPTPQYQSPSIPMPQSGYDPACMSICMNGKDASAFTYCQIHCRR
ncbi:MAG: hypothetical protein WA373_01995 [Burkholderiales bacterium]